MRLLMHLPHTETCRQYRFKLILVIAITIPIPFQTCCSTLVTITTEDGACRDKLFIWEESSFPSKIPFIALGKNEKSC